MIATHRLRLTDHDLLLLRTALDEFLPYPVGDSRWLTVSQAEADRLWPYRLLRGRLEKPIPGGTSISLREERRRQRGDDFEAGGPPHV